MSPRRSGTTSWPFALKDRPALQFPMPPGVTMAKWDTGSGTVTDAFKPDQVPGASGSGIGDGSSAVGERVGVGSGVTAGDGGQRRRASSGGVDSQHGRAVLSAPLSTRSDVMSTEADALNEQIKQSVALLRRHL